MDTSYVITIVIGYLLYICDANKDKELRCAVCRALVDEMNYGISQVDPKKTVQVGSFRVDSKGDQNTYMKPYARSEIHLTELFENICDKFSQYALTKNSKGEKSVIPTASRDGKGISLKDVTISSDATKKMKFLCQSLVEEHEEDMIKVLSKSDIENEENEICGNIAEVCSDEDLAIPMPSQESPQYRREESEKEEEEDDEDEEEEEDENDDSIDDLNAKEEL